MIIIILKEKNDYAYRQLQLIFYRPSCVPNANLFIKASTNVPIKLIDKTQKITNQN